MSKKFQASSFIGYVCEEQDEIANLQRLNINELKISKKRFHDDYYEMHLFDELKPKTVTLTFNKNLTTKEPSQTPQNDINLFYLPKQYRKLILHIIQTTILFKQHEARQNNENILKHYFNQFYYKFLTNYLLLKYFFIYKKMKKRDARIVKMSENL